jgi:hypothetical protein
LRREYDTTIRELLMKISAQVNADTEKRLRVIEQQTATKKEIATLQKTSIALEFECVSLTAQIRRGESLLEGIKNHVKGTAVAKASFPVPDAGMGITTVAENVTIALTSTDIGEDAAAGDDLGQNAFNQLQGFRGELIAKAGGLITKDDKDVVHVGVSQAQEETSTGDGRSGRDRQGVHHASDHRIEQRSLHGYINVEEFKSEKEFRSLWDSFTSDIYSNTKLKNAILTLRAIIDEARTDNDLEKVT